jgi:low affinity Fe/Cu permease
MELPHPREAWPDRRWNERFQAFAYWSSQWMGTHWAFLIALWVVVLWLLFGPVFHFFGDLAAR